MTTAIPTKAIPTKSMPTITNGVNVDQVMEVINNIEDNANYAKCQFRAQNQWQNGSLNRTRLKEFYAGCQEDDTRTQPFYLDADEPPLLAGADTAPNPVEYVLHALAGCLTTTLVYHAAVNDIPIEAIETELSGDIDLRGLFGMSNEVRKGYNYVRVHMRVKSDADAEQLRNLACFSPVYDIVSNSLEVEFTLGTC